MVQVRYCCSMLSSWESAWKKVEIDEAIKWLNAIRVECVGPVVGVHVSLGSPAEEIVRLASKENVSLIVINACGK